LQLKTDLFAQHVNNEKKILVNVEEKDDVLDGDVAWRRIKDASTSAWQGLKVKLQPEAMRRFRSTGWSAQRKIPPSLCWFGFIVINLIPVNTAPKTIINFPRFYWKLQPNICVVGYSTSL